MKKISYRCFSQAANLRLGESRISTFRAASSLFKQHTIVAGDLAAALATLSKHEEASYSAAWIDCLAKGSTLGRSLIYLGEHATEKDVETLRPGAPRVPPQRTRHLAVPIDLPSFTLNRFSVAASYDGHG